MIQIPNLKYKTKKVIYPIKLLHCIIIRNVFNFGDILFVVLICGLSKKKKKKEKVRKKSRIIILSFFINPLKIIKKIINLTIISISY